MYIISLLAILIDNFEIKFDNHIVGENTCGKKRKFIFLYLNTGAGHLNAANILADALREKNPDTEILTVNGFGESNHVGHVFYEFGYQFACNYLHGAYPLVYDVGQFHPVQTFLLNLIYKKSLRHVRKIFWRERPTDVVSFHFLLSPVAKAAAAMMNFPVNVNVLVTDPFTAHTSWFYDNTMKFLVYSEDVKKIGVEKRQVKPENISVVPFLLNEKYKTQLSKDEKRAMKARHGFDANKKIVLLVGGGEGLPGASEIIRLCVDSPVKRVVQRLTNEYAENTNDFAVAVVCGRNKIQYEALTLLAKTNMWLDLHVFGFVDFVDELVKIADCVVTKAGPSMLMEVLCARKPVIISTYIHNQELGNMRFAVYNNVGFFIQKPRDIYKKIIDILDDNDFEERMQKNFDSLKLDTDASVVAQKLLEE